MGRAQGIDLESEWCFTRPAAIPVPEVNALETQVDSLMAGPNPISVALNLHSTRSTFADSFFFKHLAPSVSPTFEIIQQNYIDAVNAVSRLFKNASPQTSQLNPCTYVESYFWNNWGESVMALKHEGHYFRRQTDNDWITGADYRSIGGPLAIGLLAYFPLPAGTEPDLTHAAWLPRFFSASELGLPDLTGENADPDDDGISNLMEYALGQQPRVPDAGTAAPGLDNIGSGMAAQLVVLAQRSSYPTDLEVFFERSADLQTWRRTPDPLAAPPLAVSAVTSTFGRRAEDGHAMEFVTLSTPRPISAEPVFYRLKARRLL